MKHPVVTSQRIVITGATGFLGRHLLPVLQARYAKATVIGLGRRDYDLMDARAVQQLFTDLSPDILIHLAAYSGGIGANRQYPADFYYQNTLLTSLVFEAAARYGVSHLIYTMGGCSYPATARSPIDETQLWEGYPHEDSAGYSMAKKMGVVASRVYRQQYGLKSTVLIPGNLYGEYDNYRTGESHVIPAMIRRFYEAARDHQPQVTMWGDGSPVRDFVYVGDVAHAIPTFIERHFDCTGPINLSSGTKTSIKTLAHHIKRLLGYSGEIHWDTSKPNGQQIKIFDITRMRDLGIACNTPLELGLKQTIQWFKTAYDQHLKALRV